MHNGFYLDRDDLIEFSNCEDANKIGFEFLCMERINKKEPEPNLYDFLHGYCFEFAWSLKEKTGYELREIRQEEELIHAYCVNNGRYYDIRGWTTDYNEMLSEFENYYTENSELTDKLATKKKPLLDENALKTASMIIDNLSDLYI